MFFNTSHCQITGVLNGDVSLIVSDFVSPPLVINKAQIFCKNEASSDIVLSFYDHFVDFNHECLVDFASKNFKFFKASKTCFIQLFHEKEAELLLNMDKMSNVYGFLQRLYSSAFESSHHIHLFAKHRRSGIDNVDEKDNDGMQMREKELDDAMEQKGSFLVQIKTMNGLRQRHLTSFSSIKLLDNLLSIIIDKNKAPPIMAMYEIAKIRLRIRVVREIKACMDATNESIADLLKHILRIDDKYHSNGLLRTSYVS